MDYRKKLKKRLCYAIGYIVIGAALVLLRFTGKLDNEIISYFGAAFGICGIARIIQYVRILSNEDKMKQREIAEKDERNVMIWTRARSLTFGIYIMLAGIATVVLYITEQYFAGQIIAYTVCGLCAIYWICYMIMSRKY